MALPMSARVNVLKGAAWSVLGAVVLWQVYKAWGLGHVSLWAVGLFHVGCAVLSLWVLRKACGVCRIQPARCRKYRLALYAVISGLLVSEAWLRFVDKDYITYNERSGTTGLYVARYKPRLLQHIMNRRQEGQFLHVDRPNQRFVREQKEFSYPYFTNSEGLRDVEHPADKPPGEYRIVVLGDSFTQGVGASFEETWPQQLKERLVVQTGNRLIRIINGGRSGSDPVYEYRLLKDRLLKYKPDLVLVAVNQSDVTDIYFRGGRERYLENGDLRLPVMPWWEPIYGCSFLVRHIVHDLIGLNYHFMTRDQNEARKAWAAQELVESLMQFHRLADEESISLIYIFHPLYEALAQHTDGMSNIVSSIERESPGQVIDLHAMFKEAAAGADATLDTFYWPLDRHHTPSGYRLFAEGVADRLLADPPAGFPSASGD